MLSEWKKSVKSLKYCMGQKNESGKKINDDKKAP